MRHLALLMIFALAPLVGAQTTETPAEETPLNDTASTETLKARSPLHPLVQMQTSMGDIVLELDAEKAPISTLNFIQYVDDGFYKGTIFHRVIPNFMIQGGGLEPDHTQKREGLRPPIKNEWRNGLKNKRGTIAMARTNVADSATAQFFINVTDNPFLDQPNDGAAYAVFGKVVKGMETVDKIRSVETRPGGENSIPVQTVLIRDAKLISEFDREAAKKLTEAAR